MSALRAADDGVPGDSQKERKDLRGAAARLKARVAKESRALKLASLVVEPEILPIGGGEVAVRWASMDERILMVEVTAPGFREFSSPNGSVRILVAETCEIVLSLTSNKQFNEYRAKVEVELPAPVKVSWAEKPARRANYLFWMARGEVVAYDQLVRWCLEMGAPKLEVVRKFLQLHLFYAWIADRDEVENTVSWKFDKFPSLEELGKEFGG